MPRHSISSIYPPGKITCSGSPLPPVLRGFFCRGKKKYVRGEEEICYFLTTLNWWEKLTAVSLFPPLLTWGLWHPPVSVFPPRAACPNLDSGRVPAAGATRLYSVWPPMVTSGICPLTRKCGCSETLAACPPALLMCRSEKR